jgi:hypothetical protein
MMRTISLTEKKRLFWLLRAYIGLRMAFHAPHLDLVFAFNVLRGELN